MPGLDLLQSYPIAFSPGSLNGVLRARIPYKSSVKRKQFFFPGGKIEVSIAVPGSLNTRLGQRIRSGSGKIVYYAKEEDARAFLKNPARVRYSQTSSTISVTAVLEPPQYWKSILRCTFQREDRHKRQNRYGELVDVNGWVEATVREA